MSSPRLSSLSVYVHFPWCLQKCPYCDFASASIERAVVPQVDYADAVLRELADRASVLQQARLVSVFFGGGTPSLWAPAELGRVLAAIRAAAGVVAEDLEVTVECNPSSLDQPRAAALCAVGVNRLSIGVQSLSSQHLRFLGRLHDGAGAISALRAGISEVPRVSGDLMFGMPGQQAAEFVAEVEQLVELGIEHLSVYALTVEPGTQFGALQRKGRLTLATENDFAETYLAAEARLAAGGFEHYEVSNYARPGHSSRHNQHYWRAGAYLGLGAGAVGCLRGAQGAGRRYRNEPRPAEYMQHSGSAAREVMVEQLEPQQTVQEGLMLGLRTVAGVDLGALTALSGLDPRSGREREIDRHTRLGNLRSEQTRLWIPQARWLHLDGIVADLF